MKPRPRFFWKNRRHLYNIALLIQDLSQSAVVLEVLTPDFLFQRVLPDSFQQKTQWILPHPHGLQLRPCRTMRSGLVIFFSFEFQISDAVLGEILRCLVDLCILSKITNICVNKKKKQKFITFLKSLKLLFLRNTHFLYLIQQI